MLEREIERMEDRWRERKKWLGGEQQQRWPLVIKKRSCAGQDEISVGYGDVLASMSRQFDAVSPSNEPRAKKGTV